MLLLLPIAAKAADSYVTLVTRPSPAPRDETIDLDAGETAECVSASNAWVGFWKGEYLYFVVDPTVEPRLRERLVVTGPAKLQLTRYGLQGSSMATFKITPGSVDTNRVLAVSSASAYVVSLQSSSDGASWTTLATSTNAPTGATNVLFRVRLSTP